MYYYVYYLLLYATIKFNLSVTKRLNVHYVNMRRFDGAFVIINNNRWKGN